MREEGDVGAQGDVGDPSDDLYATDDLYGRLRQVWSISRRHTYGRSSGTTGKRSRWKSGALATTADR